ncbi:MAG TPA: C39 family peptidase [Verrucomicrobiota bacterium]|nr:C39 family peptidase [Verrucomicrobiota bacterium]HNT16216.1 C39 family peptidase [Verrucomicrobiota bacterium]
MKGIGGGFSSGAIGILLVPGLALAAATVEFHGEQFLPFRSFHAFARTVQPDAGITLLTSPEIETGIHWDELVISWNAEAQPTDWLEVKARALYPDHATKWFTFGQWSGAPGIHARASVKHQEDVEGHMDTDTLILQQPVNRLQVQITLGSTTRTPPRLKFLGLSVLDSKYQPAARPPNRRAWGKWIEVPKRAQMDYPHGEVLCSATTTSMLLAYWGQQLNRPGLNVDVPEVVQQIFDPVWNGTGNWIFNTAYAGSFRWMRAYTTRLLDLTELEDFIARGIPVGLSVCSNRLNARSRIPSGHLVVLVGFTAAGDPIINDPGKSQKTPHVFPRERVRDAWAYSKNAVYLIYPVNTVLPTDHFGHWESRTAKRAIKLLP